MIFLLLIRLAFCFPIVAPLCLASVSAIERYEFTDLKDRKLEARILSCNREEVRVERVSDGRTFEIPLTDLCEADRAYLAEQYLEKADDGEAGLVPGETLTLDFPDMGEMERGQPARCELRIPGNYDPVRPVPLLVWFGGGKGSHKVNGARELVDFDEFLVLALPYPEGRLPRLAVKEGEDAIDAFWEFQRPMLERVIEMVPNISEDVRIAGGSSSGGHLVGSALDRKWRGFCDYFTGYVLHEGGTSPDMEYRGTRSSHRLLVTYGEETPHMEWQRYFMERIGEQSGRFTFLGIPDAKHGLTGKGRGMIREWIETTFEEELR